MKRLLALAGLLLLTALITGCGTGSAKVQSPTASTPKSAPTSTSTVSTLQLASSSLPKGTVGSGYSLTLQATGGTAPYTWSVASGSLPVGLTLSTSGTISGTATSSGAFSFSVTVKDAESTPQAVTSALSLAVVAVSTTSTSAPTPTSTSTPVSVQALQLTSSTLTNGTVGIAYSARLSASGGTAPYNWSVASGSLPAGLALSPSGTISGTATSSGSFSFSVTVKDAESTPQAVTSALKLTIVAAPTTSATPPPVSTGSATFSAAYAAYIAANYGSAQGYTSANTYYVSATGSDSNSGSASSPWKTLSHAGSATPACALIMIGSGSWTSTSQVVSLSSSGTSTCHKAFVSQTYAGAAFSSTGDTGNGGAVFSLNGNYVDIAGIDISGTACAGMMPSGTYNNLVYNRVHDVAPNASGQASGYCGNGTGGGGIQFPGASTNTGQHSNVLNNVIWNIGYSGDVWTHGIYIVSQYQALQNNIIYNVSGGCIQAYHYPSNDVITNNVLVKCNWGYIVGAESGYAASNMTFNNNAMAGNVSNDIQECGASYCGVAMGSGNTYSNNDTSSTSAGNHLEGGTLVNNITSSPSFVDEASPASGGNFDVNSGSPLIGAGTSSNAPAADILGVSRQGTAVNIGAFQE